MRKFTIALLVLLFAGMNFAFAQVRTISGTVTSSDDGSKLPGVTIRVKGTNVGTITDVHGNYTLKVGEDAKVLVFSFVGMRTQEINIEGKDIINVALASETKGLSEVVVMGYTTKGKNELTGSVVQVSGSSINEVPVATPDQALQGKVAGLEISSSSGTPGSVADIRIRGVGSITAGNQPLIVVDGVPVNSTNLSGSTATSSLSDLAAINSDDIASITVLKDASATAAYGARGSNGVIVITTKQGRMDSKTTFNFSAYLGYQNNAVQGEVPLTGEQRKTLFLQAVYNTFGADYGFDQAGAYDFAINNGLDYGYLASWDGKNADWTKVMTNKNAPVKSYNLSASGGDKVSSFYASVGYDKTEGTVISSSFKRFSATLNYNRDLTKKLKFSTNNIVSNTHQNAYLEQSAYYGNPNLAKYFESPWIHPYNADGTINLSPDLGAFNPLYIAKYNISFNDLTRAISNSFLEYTIIKNLRFKTLISFDYSLANYKTYDNPNYGDGEGIGGYAENSDDKYFNLVTQNSLDYVFRYHDHMFSFKALMEYQKNTENYLYGYGENFPTLGLTNIASTSANWNAYSSFNDWSNLSYLGMINYNYRGKYIADFTIRREGSSKFATDKRFGNFWAIGAAWNMSQESFLSNVKFINSLRIRGSYGLSGNSDILDVNGNPALHSWQNLLSYSATYAGSGGSLPSQFGNNNLTWEKNNTLDLGVDFTLWNNKINGTVAYYNKKTFDLLQNVPLSMTTGFTTQDQNVGTVINKGIEATLSVDIIRSEHLNWTISGNFATVNNEVTKLAKNADGTDINIETGSRKVAVGHPIYAWYMQKYAGVDPQTGNALWYLDGNSGETTTNYYAAAKAYQGGSALPTYTGGLSTHVDYRGFFVDASFYFSGGNKIYQDWAFYTNNSGLYTTLFFNGVSELTNAWTQPGDVTDVPKMVYSTSSNNSRTSTRFLYSGNYVRLKGLTFGYSVPKRYLSHIKFDGATVYVRGSNIFTWVKDKRLKYDPEVGADGFTMLTTPPVKSIVFGVNLKF
ncbi:MAG: SusC/RagA family TonB-linked outer membrane protein [Bacteroidales bacterium]|nr:SusC/RagA family TonB-linked outer membrane protein [Bacteroidales bacterium]